MTGRWSRIVAVLTKDLRLGPRSPLVPWVLFLPIALTLLVRGVFGGLFDADPRLGIVDFGDSEVTRGALVLDGIEVRLLEDPAELRSLLERNDLDAGLILRDGFDDAVRAGLRPELEFFVSGESLADTRVVLAVAVLDLIREVEGSSSQIDVEVQILGEAPLPFEIRMLPLVVILAVALAGVMIPAASLVDEKQRGTALAMLVTPMSIGELLAAKGLLGVLLAFLTGTVTLIVNGALTAPFVMLVSVLLGAVMMAQVGLALGAWARDVETMFAAWKAGGLLLFFPVLFFVWPGLPRWPARLGPTYYFLAPMYEAGVEGAGLRDVLADLVIALVICIALVPLVRRMGRRMEGRVGTRRSVPTEIDLAGD